MKQTLVLIIGFYQRYISPDTGIFRGTLFRYPVCTMYPSCSEYMKISIDRHGPIAGIYFGVRRIFRCHPYQRKLIDHP